MRDLQRRAHAIALERGWWDEPRTFGDLIALVHCELSEAMEAYRFEGVVLPDGEVATELADVIIRVMDLAAYYGIDLETAVVEKMDYNATRSYRHGGKAL